jgi:hypothetical protein
MTVLKTANAFNWKRYTDEDLVRRGGKPLLPKTDYQRSAASTKAVERIRETNPTYGTLGISGKTAELIALRPKNFTIYSKAGKP